jgi:hypothetical protein
MVKHDISSLWTLYRFGSWVPDIALELCDARAQLVGREIVGTFCTQQLVEVLPRCQRSSTCQRVTQLEVKKNLDMEIAVGEVLAGFPKMTIFP